MSQPLEKIGPKIVPAHYVRPKLILDLQNQQIFQEILNGTGSFETYVPFLTIDGLTDIVYEANISSRPWMGKAAARSLIREAAIEGRERNDPSRAGYEIFVDSGCIHGARPEKLVELIQRDHPDRVFISDLVGSQGFSEETKRIYYNKLMNVIRNRLLPAHPEYFVDDSLHTTDFLDVNFSEDPDRSFTPKDGFKELIGCVLRYNPHDSVALQMKVWDDNQIALWIWYFAHKDQYHGQWMATLDKTTRKMISTDVEREVEDLIQVIEAKRGDSETFYFEGNWDGKVTMQNVTEGNYIGNQVIERITNETITKQEVIQLSRTPFTENSPHDPLERGFDYKAILERKGKRLITEVEEFETDNCFHIVGPYFALLALSREDRRYQLVAHKAQEAKKRGKMVVLHMHGVPDRELLFLDKLLVAVGDNQIVERNLHQLMHDTQAQVLIHPHEHDPKRYADGSIMSTNNHIVYTVGDEESEKARVVTDVSKLGQDSQLISVYTPKQPALSVMVVGSEPQKDLFQGTSLPPKVLFAPENS